MQPIKCCGGKAKHGCIEEMGTKTVGLEALAAKFEYFLIDQYGVLHDGNVAYPGAASALRYLRQAGKCVVLISNSGKRAKANAVRAEGLGFTTDCYDLFVSSGEVAWQTLKQGGVVPPTAHNTWFVLARGGGSDALQDIDLEIVDDIAKAAHILLSGVEPERYGIEDYKALLAPSAARNIPLLCSNLDQQSFTTESQISYGPGAVADIYERLGGPVQRIGKPFAAIYDYVFAKLGAELADRSRAVAIGDSEAHDIIGAKNAGCAAALVLTGLQAGRTLSEIKTQADFILPALTWPPPTD